MDGTGTVILRTSALDKAASYVKYYGKAIASLYFSTQAFVSMQHHENHS